MVKVMVGVCSSGQTMCIGTAMSLVSAVKNTPVPMILSVQAGPYTHWNREAMVEEAIHDECSHVLFVDTDVTFPNDAFMRLLSAGKDVIGAGYNMKTDPPIGTWKVAKPDTDWLNLSSEDLVEKGSEENNDGMPIRVAAVPTGLMLINLEAIEEVPRPLFVCDWKSDPNERMGEDIYFCFNVNHAGKEVWLDPGIQVGHVGNKVY